MRTSAGRAPEHTPCGSGHANDRLSVRAPLKRAISKRLYRHISQSVCPWNVKFSQTLAVESPFTAREFIAEKDAVTLARDILALDQKACSAAFRKSPMKRTRLRAFQRNAAVVRGNLAKQ